MLLRGHLDGLKLPGGALDANGFHGLQLVVSSLPAQLSDPSWALPDLANPDR